MRLRISAFRARERARGKRLTRDRQCLGKLCEFGGEPQIRDLLNLGADLQKQPFALQRYFKRLAAANGARHRRQQR